MWQRPGTASFVSSGRVSFHLCRGGQVPPQRRIASIRASTRLREMLSDGGGALAITPLPVLTAHLSQSHRPNESHSLRSASPPSRGAGGRVEPGRLDGGLQGMALVRSFSGGQGQGDKTRTRGSGVCFKKRAPNQQAPAASRRRLQTWLGLANMAFPTSRAGFSCLRLLATWWCAPQTKGTI
jgi:hypothetical protein